MASRRDRHQAKVNALSALGKQLSRRSRSRCELCEHDVGLKVVEVSPAFEEPSVERAALLCEPCRSRASGKRDGREVSELRFLEQAIWSEVLPVQLLALRLTREVAAMEVRWAVDGLDALWLPEDVEALL